MAIHFRDRRGTHARVASTLADTTSVINGTFTPITTRTAIIRPQLADVTALFQGIFQQQVPSRTGSIGTTLAAATTVIQGTFTAAAAPSQPGTLSASLITTTTLRLTWGASTNMTLGANCHYNIFRDGVLTSQTANGNPPATSQGLTSLTPGRTYTWYVVAVNPAGTSSASNIITTTMLSAVSWSTIPTFTVNRSGTYPQYITNIRQYLVDPGTEVTAITIEQL